MALGVQANASTQREWFCVAVENRLKESFRKTPELKIEGVMAKESNVVLQSVPILYTYAHILSDTSQL